MVVLGGTREASDGRGIGWGRRIGDELTPGKGEAHTSIKKKN